MQTYLLLRVDGDTYAVDYDGDAASAIADAMDIAIPDPGSTLHVALVDSSDAGAARLAPVEYWIGATDTDGDAVAQGVHCMGLDPESVDVGAIVALAAALVAATPDTDGGEWCE